MVRLLPPRPPMLRNVGGFQNPVTVDISRAVKNFFLSQQDVTQLAEHPAVILKRKICVLL